MLAILDFRLERIKLFLIYKSHRYFLPSVKSIGLLFKDEKRKIDFQDAHGGHLGFQIGTQFFFSVQEKKHKIVFQVARHGGHLGFLI